MNKGERARLVSTESLASLKSAVAQIRPERDPVVSKDNNVVIDFRDAISGITVWMPWALCLLLDY